MANNNVCEDSRKKLNLDFYKKLYLIRKSELEIQRYYKENEMKTPMHMSMGEEAIVVGVLQNLKEEDQIFTTYRSHAAFLAKTQDTDFFFSEMYARDTSPLKGKGGSMHLCYPELGFMGSSAIVASHIPVAVGAAFANKFQKNNRIVVVFFGDGAIDEGVFWESINTACLKNVPILFVCEDNDLAVHTFTSMRRGYDSITDIISKFNCFVFESDSTDVEIIYNLTNHALELIRRDVPDIWPIFMNFKYYRYLEHVGIADDFNSGYRSIEEFEKWKEKDPIILQRKKLLELDIAEEEICNIEKIINEKISRSIYMAKKAPLSNKSELYTCIFK